MSARDLASTTQDALSAMRGHVIAGQRVAMNDGSVVVIEATMAGWRIVSDAGQVLQDCGASAARVEHWIAAHR